LMKKFYNKIHVLTLDCNVHVHLSNQTVLSYLVIVYLVNIVVCDFPERFCCKGC
jgi:hypothetical protein